MGEKPMTGAQVHIWEEDVEIPTYGTGEPDKNPMFLEKRVYQGSSGKVYPYPVIDKIRDEKRPQAYRIVFLENEYLHIEILPQLGGRIYRALDKTNGYDFVYYNRVIKPALVGLAGPWISGGIEFNWPQHHRPNTFGPVEYHIEHHTDGSKTTWVSEIDRMYGTKMTAGFTLYPGKAYLEIHVQLYNRTPEPQTFLWWANPAVSVNEHTQSIFPPDVHAVFDHGKRDVSRFPTATGTYYKVDYSAGVDISRYKNIPVPTSYMAYHSDYNFIGGYDHSVQAGILHVANHHISPGKKQWTWGCGEFGKAWDRNLTDEDGPYIELMTGVYTDNQPDFAWLQPYENKSFKQYFMPYKNIGIVKNASIDAAVNLEVNSAQHTVNLQVYATSVFANAMIELKSQRQVYVNETMTISPTQIFATVVPLDSEDQADDLIARVKDAHGNVLIDYQPKRPQIEKLPDPAKPLPIPEEMRTNEALYLAGLHLEQYRHATFEPELYYLEGLKHDPGDSRINVAYGTLLLRRGLFRESEAHFRKAIATLTRHNPNPYDSEAYYQLGVTLKMQGRLEEARAAFYKATWSSAWQDSGYFSIAQIACKKKDYLEALELVEKSLMRNTRNYQARDLKAALLRKLGHLEEAEHIALETIRLDSADFGAYNERYLIHLARGEQIQAGALRNELTRLMRDDVHNSIALVVDYLHCGLHEEGIDVLHRLVLDAKQNAYPMLHYYLGYFYEKLGRLELARAHLRTASTATPDYCFPNSLDDLVVLESAIAAHPGDAKAHYYLGNLLYDKKRYVGAIQHWEASREADSSFATVHRNLALAYYNISGKADQALSSLEKAFTCNPVDARVFYELDQLYKKLGYAPEKRLANLESHWELVTARDDLYLEYITLLNTLKQHKKAIALLSARKFHPWEGGEGKVTGQYVLAHIELGKHYLHIQQDKDAIETLKKALVYPENLGEGKLAGAQENNIHYFLGCAYKRLGLTEKATEYFLAASQGLEEPASAMFYNDQPPDMIFYQGLAWLKLGNAKDARRRFNKLIDYGEQHLFDNVKIDYFAVSLPDFLVFEDDLDRRNKVHCLYMMGLGHLGLREFKKAWTYFSRALELDVNHQGTRIHLEMCPEHEAFRNFVDL
jgi:tetratricopeptide (TPR) repeat protein